MGVARTFNWGGPKQKFLKRRHQNFSKEELIVKQRNRRMENKKTWPGLALDQDFAEGRGIKPKDKK